jgi:FkbM family methyltransferase
LAGAVLEHVSPDHRFVLVDVGARGGLDHLWSRVEDQILTIGFEPDRQSFDSLEASELRRYFPVALWERSEPLTLYCASSPGKTSVYPPCFETLRAFPDPERFETVEEVRLPASSVETLDTVLGNDGIRDVDFIKLDTQGSELPILKGATDTVATAAAVKVEVEFVELYEGQPLFSDVECFMRAAGFQLVDLQRRYWKRDGYVKYPGQGQLIWADALYFRDQDEFLTGLEHGDPGWAQSKVIKFAAACLLYGMHDYAVTLLEDACRRELVDGRLCSSLREMVAAHDARVLPQDLSWLHPKLRRFVGYSQRQWRKAERRLDAGDGWSNADVFLGNG